MMDMYAVFGMNYLCKWFIHEIGIESISYIIDNNSSLWGTKWNGIAIVSLNEYLNTGDESSIIIASKHHYREIQEQLINEGIDRIVTITRAWADSKLERKKGRKIFLMNTHSYTNGGDYFITIAEKKYLSDYFSAYERVLIPSMVCSDSVIDLKTYITDDDLILISGGGYLGNLWMENGEDNVRNIIKVFPNNRIIIFPQSMYFSGDINGQNEKEITAEIFNEHNNLTICLREQNSFDVAKQILKPETIMLIPDITFLYDRVVDSHRKGFALCFRDDKESCLSKSIRDELIKKLSTEKETIDNICMEINETLNEDEAEREVEKKIIQISEYKIVITDRLHCMMMCLATKTPCIVFDNLSCKISGTYEFINQISYIKMASQIENIESLINELLNCETNDYYYLEWIRKQYKRLTDVIVNTWEKQKNVF